MRHTPCALLAMLPLCAIALAADLPSALKACRTVADDAQRLACYDREVGAAQAAAADAPVKNFGLNQAQLRARDPDAARDAAHPELAATIRSAHTNSDGLWVFELANGQVWRQVVGESVRWNVGDPVKIVPATFGSFIMELPQNRTTRVRRVR